MGRYKGHRRPMAPVHVSKPKPPPETLPIPVEWSSDSDASDVSQSMIVDVPEDIDEIPVRDVPVSDMSDDEDEPPPEVKNPSMDIRTDLENVLSEDVDFDGSFYFSKACPEAPNPLLRIDGPGRIGLPLSEPEARRLTSCSKQAPFGKGERTLVDTSVRDTWEIDGSKVHFDNAAWTTFMNGTVKEICRTLGVHYETSKPRCELYKLLIYEKGSHFLPHQDTEKANGMFATVIVILPSEFSGGAVHLSHGHLSTVADHSQNSLSSTAIISWYTDVMHEVKPVTSGYRLALAYNLVDTTSALRPILSDNTQAVPQLRHLMLSWQQDLESNPKKLIYLFDHTYSQANLRASALKGKDAHYVALLDAISTECCVRVALATIECVHSGPSDDTFGAREHDSGWGRRKYHSYGSDSENSEDEESEPDYSHLGFEEIEAREMRITGLVDLDGRKMMSELQLAYPYDDDEEDDLLETIPADLKDQVEGGPVDEQQYGGYQGNGAGQLDHFYRRSVAVIWPIQNDPNILFGNDYAEYATNALRTSTSMEPTKSERQHLCFLFEFELLPGSETLGVTILQSVCDAACRWKASSVWCQAVKKYEGDSGVERLGVEGFAKAIIAFGIEKIQFEISRAIEIESSNTAAFRFLDEMKARLISPALTSWIPEKIALRIRSLKKLDRSEGPMLLDLARKNEGAAFLFDVIVPQIPKCSAPKDIPVFVDVLAKEQVSPTSIIQSAAEEARRTHVIRKMIKIGIANTDFFGVVPVNDDHYHRYNAKLGPNSDLTFRYIETCFRTGNEDLIKKILKRIIPAHSAADSQPSPSSRVCLPLLSRLNPILADRALEDPPVPGLDQFYAFTAPTLLKKFFTKYEEPTKNDITSLVHSGIFGGIQLLTDTRVDGFEKVVRRVAGYREFIDQLSNRRHHFKEEASQVTPLALRLGETAIHGMSCRDESEEPMKLLDVFMKHSYTSLCKNVLERLLPEDYEDFEDLDSEDCGIISPLSLVTQVAALLGKHALSRISKPYASFFKTTMLKWSKTALGSKEASMLQAKLKQIRFGSCSCEDCRQVGKFFKSKEPSLALYRIGARRIKHIVEELDKAPGADAVATWETVKTESPQGFRMTKKPKVVKALRWPDKGKQGLKALRSISSDDPILITILGDAYPKLCALFGVVFINGDATASMTTSTSAAGSKTTSSSVTVQGNGPANRTGTSSKRKESANPKAEVKKPAVKRRTETNELDIIDLTSP